MQQQDPPLHLLQQTLEQLLKVDQELKLQMQMMQLTSCGGGVFSVPLLQV